MEGTDARGSDTIAAMDGPGARDCDARATSAVDEEGTPSGMAASNLDHDLGAETDSVPDLLLGLAELSVSGGVGHQQAQQVLKNFGKLLYKERSPEKVKKGFKVVESVFEKLENNHVQLWEALAHPLPDIGFCRGQKRKGSSSVKADRLPREVIPFSKEVFTKIVEKYRARAQAEELVIPSFQASLENIGKHYEGHGEKAIDTHCAQVLRNVLHSLNQLLPDGVERISIGDHNGLNIQPDICVNMVTKGASEFTANKVQRESLGTEGLPTFLNCIVEVKRPSYYTDGHASLAMEWCPDGGDSCDQKCGKENHPKGGLKDNLISPIAQLFGYLKKIGPNAKKCGMVSQEAGIRLGVLTTYEQWWFVARDVYDRLYISESFNRADSPSESPSQDVTTVTQALAMWTLLAMDSSEAIHESLVTNLERYESLPPVTSFGLVRSCSEEKFKFILASKGVRRYARISEYLRKAVSGIPWKVCQGERKERAQEVFMEIMEWFLSQDHSVSTLVFQFRQRSHSFTMKAKVFRDVERPGVKVCVFIPHDSVLKKLQEKQHSTWYQCAPAREQQQEKRRASF